MDLLSKERLDEVVRAIQRALSDETMRQLPQRAVQAKLWHREPVVSAILVQLRQDEDALKKAMFHKISTLIYEFHEHTLDATLARAGLMHDQRLHAGSSLSDKEAFDLKCLDAKERLYMLLEQYGWLQSFFELYPLHFYENSYKFVSQIPPKSLKVSVKIVGLGIGGSIATSGLAKNGCRKVIGIEKRAEKGPKSVTSRYQSKYDDTTKCGLHWLHLGYSIRSSFSLYFLRFLSPDASWRAYDVAARMVDEEAFQELTENRQKINVTYDDGSTAVVTADRVQIIIGQAIQSAINSARKYGADIHFERQVSDFPEKCDLVGLFCGAHTAHVVPGLKDEMGIYSWPELDSTCKMWLQVQESVHTDAFCTRGGEIGAEQWHYTINSARNRPEDLQRIIDNLDSQYQYHCEKVDQGASVDGMSKDEITAKYEAQRAIVVNLLEKLNHGKLPSGRYDYIFTNAPANQHNALKREQAENVALDGGYTVQIKMSTKSVIHSGPLLDKLNTDMIVCGGDASVPPNPLAAYGATLACEAAGNLVQLATAIGHLNSILEAMEGQGKPEWIEKLNEIKTDMALHFEARSRSENYFQWVQTLICNLYSLPAFN